jgi:hypothetical protein
MDIHICSDYFTRFCQRWNGYKQPCTIIVDNLDYDSISDFALTDERNNFPTAVYQILPDNLSEIDIHIINLNLQNINIIDMYLIAPYPQPPNIIQETKTNVTWLYLENGVFNDIFKIFRMDRVNIILFDVVFFNNEDLFNCKTICPNIAGLICAREISENFIKPINAQLDTLTKPMPLVMYEYSGIVTVGPINIPGDIHLNWYGASNIVIKRIFEKKNIINLSKIFRCYKVSSTVVTPSNNYVNLDEFCLIFSILYSNFSEKEKKVLELDGFKFLDAITNKPIPELEKYTFRDIQKRKQILSISESIKLVEIQNSLIHNFYKKYEEVYQAKLVDIDYYVENTYRPKIEQEVRIETEARNLEIRNERMKHYETIYSNLYEQQVKNLELEINFRRTEADESLSKHEKKIAGLIQDKTSEYLNAISIINTQHESETNSLVEQQRQKIAELKGVHELDIELTTSQHLNQLREIRDAQSKEIQSIISEQHVIERKTVEELTENFKKRVLDENLKLEMERIDFHNRELDRLTDKLAKKRTEIEEEIEKLAVEKQRKEKLFDIELAAAKEAKMKRLFNELSQV